jgi:hypothetical protein
MKKLIVTPLNCRGGLHDLSSGEGWVETMDLGYFGVLQNGDVTARYERRPSVFVIVTHAAALYNLFIFYYIVIYIYIRRHAQTYA